MRFDAEYSQDQEFLKLLQRRADVDLTRAALELCRDAYPNLSFDTTLEWIAARGEELQGPAARAVNERAALEQVADCLAGTYGLCGDKDAYGRADSSYLPRVIESQRGIPISLSVLYMAVANAAGLDLRGVAAPMHFLTRCETTEGPLYVDAFCGGRMMTYQECGRWLHELTDLPMAQIFPALEPIGPRPIILRMLSNLKALHVRQEDWGAAWLVQQRLTALQPASYPNRRDLALLAMRSDRPGRAVDLLESCLRTCPEHDRPLLMRQLDEATSQLARWN